MTIEYSPGFSRAYRKRIRGTELAPIFDDRLEAFTANPFEPSLRTHKLSGQLAGSWAFRLNYDYRIVFRFLADDHVILLDVGKHDQVY